MGVPGMWTGSLLPPPCPAGVMTLSSPAPWRWGEGGAASQPPTMGLFGGVHGQGTRLEGPGTMTFYPEVTMKKQQETHQEGV